MCTVGLKIFDDNDFSDILNASAVTPSTIPLYIHTNKMISQKLSHTTEIFWQSVALPFRNPLLSLFIHTCTHTPNTRQ